MVVIILVYSFLMQRKEGIKINKKKYRKNLVGNGNSCTFAADFKRYLSYGKNEVFS